MGRVEYEIQMKCKTVWAFLATSASEEEARDDLKAYAEDGETVRLVKRTITEEVIG